MPKSVIIRVLVAVNLFVLACWGMYRFVSGLREKAEDQKMAVEIAAHNEKEGILSKEATLRSSDILRSVEHTGKLSTEEYDWLMARFKESLSNNAPYACIARSDLAEPLYLAKNLTTAQKETFYQEAIALFSTKPAPHPTSVTDGSLDRVTGCNIMMFLKDRRAVPYLMPLLANSDPAVRDRAKTALNVLGFTAKK